MINQYICLMCNKTFYSILDGREAFSEHIMSTHFELKRGIDYGTNTNSGHYLDAASVYPGAFRKVSEFNIETAARALTLYADALGE